MCRVLKTKSDAVEHRVANFNKDLPHFNKHFCDCAALITNTFVFVIKAVDRLFVGHVTLREVVSRISVVN